MIEVIENVNPPNIKIQSMLGTGIQIQGLLISQNSMSQIPQQEINLISLIQDTDLDDPVVLYKNKTQEEC